MKSLKLGTRRSLLAWAQSGWVARELERLNPGVSVELVGIDTRGDKILDVSLRQVAGKEFFVAELDDALKSGAVDLTVHSMKDLSLDRPSEFVCAAIPARENSRDVVLFGPEVLDKIRKGQLLRIGTSSPRRQVNIPPFLSAALPTVDGKAPRVELVEIRGNVNTRLSRVHEPAGSDRALDGVVLAFAGLTRLWNDEPGRAELCKLLSGVRWMILPLRECPAAPAQGALAVECRASDADVRQIVSRLHDEKTANRVARERQLLADWGGGCHQRFGATCVIENGIGALFFVRGEKPDGEFVDELQWTAPAPVSSSGFWNGVEWRSEAAETQPLAMGSGQISGRSVFVSHSRALPEGSESILFGKDVWTSGVSSWKRLAARGVWVMGCAENLGFDSVKATLKEPVLNLDSQWTVLTHEKAAGDWPPGFEVLSTYRMDVEYGTDARAALRAASDVFWSSGSQYDALNQEASAGVRHACGPGKTAVRLREEGIEPLVFPSVEEWKKWILRT